MGCQVITFNTAIKASLIVFGLAFFVPAASLAQESEGQGAPRDALDRGTPFSSARAFLLATGALDYETAANYLDLRNLPDTVADEGGAELARQLDFVLSRTLKVDDYVLDDTPSGQQGDGLPDYRDLLATIQGDDEEIDLYMQRVPREDGVMIWKISNRSVADIPELYAYYANPEWVENIRERLPDDAGFLGLELYKWVITLGFALLAWPIFYLFGLLLSKVLLRSDHHLHPFVRGVLTGPLVALGVLMVIGTILNDLGMGAVAQKYSDAKTIVIIVLVWLSWSIVSLYQKYKQERLSRQGRAGAARIIRPASNFIKLMLVLVGLLVWLSNIGVNITTLLAGLGVGGLAIALALQKPLEDLMGALTLFSQQPVKVGDFCKYGSVVGVVEDIGLRTTRIRTLNNTLVAIPNAKISISDIENYTARNKFYYSPGLRLRYDCSTQQIRAIIEHIEEMLDADDRVLKDVIRARFREFGDDAILIKIQAYVDCKDFGEYLEVAQDLNFKIMEIVEAQGAAFALPGRMIYGAPEDQTRKD